MELFVGARSRRSRPERKLGLDGDGADEVVIADPAQSWGVKVVKQTAGGNWRPVAAFSALARCEKVRQALRAGEFRLVPPSWQDIEAAGVKLHLAPVQQQDAAANKYP